MKKTSKFSLNIALLSAFVMILFGCGKDESLVPDNESINGTNYARLYRDSAFLGCEGDLYDPDIIWENMRIYSPAYDRMKRHLKIKDNLLTWDFTNAAELKVSQNIYDYVTCMWGLDNQKLATKEYDLKLEGTNFSIRPVYIKTRFSRSFNLGSDHKYNMGVCIILIDHVREGYLSTYIHNLSSFLRDGYGGGRKKGSGEGEGGTTWGYSCFYACNTQELGWQCWDNYICANNASIRGGDVVYEQLLNAKHSPLITVINRKYFPEKVTVD